METCFISHDGDDLTVVNEISKIVETAGLKPFIASRDIRHSADWPSALQTEIEAADWFIVVLSAKSVDSKWVTRELTFAVAKIPSRVIPIRIAGCPDDAFGFLLSTIQHINYVGDQLSAVALVRHLRAAHDRPQRAAAVAGDWQGTVDQDIGADGLPLTYDVSLTLRIAMRGISGHFRFVNPVDQYEMGQFRITGGLLFERFLQVHYLADDPTIVQFGSVVSEINDQASGMAGRFVGYGARSGGIVTGSVKCTKK